MKVLKFCFLLMNLQISFVVGAQNEGNKWVIGYYGYGSPDYSIMHLDFSDAELKIDWHFDEDMIIRETSSSIGDIGGESILWTNGMQIFGKNGIHITDTI